MADEDASSAVFSSAGGGDGVATPAGGGAARAACLAEITATLLAALRARAHVNIAKLKQDLASKHGLSSIPKLIELIAALPEEFRERLSPFLRTKPVRSASGVAVVAVMCKPHRCPHLAFTGAVCVYCAFDLNGGGPARPLCAPPPPP
jgi:histone acetyltransferase (RNA polymerase elongator complex component)